SGMSGRERRVSNQASITVEHRDLNLDRLAGYDLCRRRVRRARNGIAERDAVSLGMGEGLGCSVGGEDARGERLRSADALGELGENCEIDRAPPRVKVAQALGELGHL